MISYRDVLLLYRLLMGLVYACMVWISHGVQTSPGVFPVSFYVLILIAYALHQVGTKDWGPLFVYRGNMYLCEKILFFIPLPESSYY